MLDKWSLQVAHCYILRKDYWKKLTWSVEVALNADLRGIEESIFLVTKTLLNLGNSLDSLGRPLGKVVKPQVTLICLQGIEPQKFLWSKGSHLTLYEQNEKPNHVSLSIGRHLEHHQLVEAQDVLEELV